MLERHELKEMSAWGLRPQAGSPCAAVGRMLQGLWGKAPNVLQALHKDSHPHHELSHSQDQNEAQTRHSPLMQNQSWPPDALSSYLTPLWDLG